MSPSAAYLRAVQDDLRTLLADPAGNVARVRIDGQPTPNCGPWFYAVHLQRINSDSESVVALDTSPSISVTITRRTGASPNAAQGDAILLANGELLDRLEQLIDRQHGSYVTMNLANAAGYLGADASHGFSEPLRFLNADAIQHRGNDWFFAPDGDDPIAGLSATAHFGGAKYTKRKI